MLWMPTRDSAISFFSSGNGMFTLKSTLSSTDRCLHRSFRSWGSILSFLQMFSSANRRLYIFGILYVGRKKMIHLFYLNFGEKTKNCVRDWSQGKEEKSGNFLTLYFRGVRNISFNWKYLNVDFNIGENQNVYRIVKMMAFTLFYYLPHLAARPWHQDTANVALVDWLGLDCRWRLKITTHIHRLKIRLWLFQMTENVPHPPKHTLCVYKWIMTDLIL
jgi:hypothetical protein